MLSRSPTVQSVDCATETVVPFQTSTTFHLTADHEPSVPLRVLELVALRGLVPDRFRCERNGDELLLELTVSGLSQQVSAQMANRMANIVAVRQAGWTPG